MTSGETGIHRLVYYSQNRIAGSEADIVVQIDAILAASRRNNAPTGVTGALLFNSGIFAQVLEGPRPAIEATFERIQCDPRHGDVHILAFEPVQARTFPSWSMGFVGPSAKDRALFSHVGEATAFEPRRLQGDRVLAIIRDIAAQEDAANHVR